VTFLSTTVQIYHCDTTIKATHSVHTFHGYISYECLNQQRPELYTSLNGNNEQKPEISIPELYILNGLINEEYYCLDKIAEGMYLC
jgi:hypothetical protein